MDEGKPGFFYGYVILLAGFFIQAVAWGIGNSFGIFFDPLIREFEWSRATVSGAASLGFLVYGIASMGLGNLNDRFGPRIIMSVCGLFLGLGYALASRIDTVWQLYLFYGLIASMGLGGADVIPLSTVSRWFLKKRGMMSGIIKVGTGVGMLAMPFFINWLLAGYGWRRSFLVLGIILLSTVCLLSCLLVRDPVKKNQLIDNGAGSLNNGHDRKEEGFTLRQALGTRQFWIVCLIYFIILFCVYTIIMHIVQHAIDLGIPSRDAAGILSVLGGVSITGRLIIGWAGDRIGEKSALMGCLFVLLCALGLLLVAEKLWMLYFFSIVYGFAHGGFFSLISPLVARFFGTRSHGILFGIVIFSSTIGGAIGPLLAGTVFDATRGYETVFMILVILCTIALVLASSLTRPVLEPAR